MRKRVPEILKAPIEARKLSTLFYTLFFLGIFSTFSSHAFAWTEELCGKFILDGPEEVSFSKNELILLCGSQKIEEWNNVSESQTLFHLKTFFEERGYFDLVTEKPGNKIKVRFPQKTLVKSWKLNDGGILESGRFRQILGQPLTPRLLDSVTERTVRALENQAYACPVVKAEADAVHGTVTANVKPIQTKVISQIQREPVEGIDTNSLRRYDAFHEGDPFSRVNLQLTEKRVSTAGILQSAYFETTCNANQVHLRERTLAGPPRIFIFGIGANTEKGPSAKISWKHLRLGKNASNLSLSLTGSFKEQIFETTSDWYFSDVFNRFHLNPQLTISHKNENLFERYEGTLGIAPATSWDNDQLSIKTSLGPTYNFVRTAQGTGPKDSKFLALNFSFQVSEHTYELYQTSPVEGFSVFLNNTFTHESLAAPLTASKAELYTTSLFNLFHWDPPAVILGFRASFATTITNEDIVTSSVLPSNFRLFLGGSTDLRGFPRLNLPGPEGALTSAYFSTEVRLASILPWSLQPLAFIDTGKMGTKTFSFDRSLYWSPGLGMRWESPIGAFRGTVARGIISDSPTGQPAQWNLYFSFGEEF